MTSLDAATVLRLGGWDPRFTRVVFIAEAQDVAVALLDADTDYNIEDFRRDELGVWHTGGAGGSVNDDAMVGMSGDAAYAYGRAEPGTVVVVDYREAACQVVTDHNGWWAFVARYVDDVDLPRVRPA